MDRESKKLKKHFEKHLQYDEMKARKRAGQLRRTFKKGKGEARQPRVTEDNWEDLLDRYGHDRKRPTISELVGRLEDARPSTMTAEEGDEEAGIVISVASGRCRVFLDGSEIDCLIPPDLAVRQKSALAVGDRARVSEASGAWRIEAVLPRRSVLARPDPLNPHMQRLIAANVDVVVHVVSLKAPPLRPRLIDRFLIAIQRGGARGVICVNKIDLLEGSARAEELAKLDPYRQLGVPVIPCSTKSGEGLEELRAAVEGTMAALVGHSGVGKSSILNALDASLALATNRVKARRGTGRHTTSASTLYDFGGGTYLIDTPGIREFGLWNLDRESLRDYFPELADPAESCRFTDCTHVHEPDCAVKDAVAAGEINRARYETYVRVWEDLK